MRRLSLIGVALLLVVSAFAQPSPGAAVVENEVDYYAQSTHHTMECGGLQREYYVYVPETLQPSKPLVFMLHGYGSKAYGYRPEMLRCAHENGFAVCVPVGWTEEGKYKPGWNVRYPVQAAMTTDDVDFIVRLKDKVVADFGFDPDNCFFSGMSNGGDLAYAVALEHPEAFAAIASVAGLEFQWMSRELTAKGPVPFMEVHGTADMTSRWDGDPHGNGKWGTYLPVPIAVGNMVSACRCEYEEISELPLKDPEKPSNKVILHRFLGSPSGCEVRLYEVCGGKHSWHLDDMDTIGEIWRFFELYLKTKKS